MRDAASRTLGGAGRQEERQAWPGKRRGLAKERRWKGDR